jgi:hypothetical protein
MKPVGVGPALSAQGIERRQGLLRAAGHHERGRDALQAVGDVREDAQRRAVGPVGVVDEDRQRALRGEVGGQPVQRVAGGERVVRGCRGRTVQLDREQRGSEPRRAGKERRRVDERAAQDLVEQLADDAEAERALELGAACSQPAGPSMTTRPPAPCAALASVSLIASSSCSRSRSRLDVIVACGAMNSPRNARVGGR